MPIRAFIEKPVIKYPMPKIIKDGSDQFSFGGDPTQEKNFKFNTQQLKFLKDKIQQRHMFWRTLREANKLNYFIFREESGYPEYYNQPHTHIKLYLADPRFRCTAEANWLINYFDFNKFKYKGKPNPLEYSYYGSDSVESMLILSEFAALDDLLAQICEIGQTQRSILVGSAIDEIGYLKNIIVNVPDEINFLWKLNSV